MIFTLIIKGHPNRFAQHFCNDDDEMSCFEQISSPAVKISESIKNVNDVSYYTILWSSII